MREREGGGEERRGGRVRFVYIGPGKNGWVRFVDHMLFVRSLLN